MLISTCFAKLWRKNLLSTVCQADIAAVFYKFRTVLNRLCSQGSIVDAGPLGTFRPTFSSKAVEKEEEFKPSTHITKTQVLFTPTSEFRTLNGVEFFKVAAKPKKKGKKKSENGAGGGHLHP